MCVTNHQILLDRFDKLLNIFTLGGPNNINLAPMVMFAIFLSYYHTRLQFLAIVLWSVAQRHHKFESRYIEYGFTSTPNEISSKDLFYIASNVIEFGGCHNRSMCTHSNAQKRKWSQLRGQTHNPKPTSTQKWINALTQYIYTYQWTLYRKRPLKAIVIIFLMVYHRQGLLESNTMDGCNRICFDCHSRQT